MSHLIYFQTVRDWLRTSMTLLLAYVYGVLWSFTIVGGFIKHYSYFLVPYIVAENPGIRPREAITLSRRMMNGHKWECFKLRLSFLGWDILGFLTFGAGSILWAVPYRVSACTEFYAAVREEARQKGIQGAERLNDELLYARAEEALLRETYADVVRLGEIADEDIVELSPVKRFFARNFGLWVGSLLEKKVHSRQEGLRLQMRLGRRELSGAAYPSRLCPFGKPGNVPITGQVSYLTPCTIWSLITVFFACCMIGWIWEVSLHLITHGVFVNRGTLIGPWLPIYGGGVLLLAVLLYRFRSKPALEAALMVVVCGTLEYMSSWLLERRTGMRWWDYSGYFLNLNGRICAEGLVVFALGGMVVIYLLVPVIDALTTRVNPKILRAVCLILLALFAIDVVYCHYVPHVGEGITSEKVAEGIRLLTPLLGFPRL